MCLSTQIIAKDCVVFWRATSYHQKFDINFPEFQPVMLFVFYGENYSSNNLGCWCQRFLKHWLCQARFERKHWSTSNMVRSTFKYTRCQRWRPLLKGCPTRYYQVWPHGTDVPEPAHPAHNAGVSLTLLAFCLGFAAPRRIYTQFLLIQLLIRT